MKVYLDQPAFFVGDDSPLLFRADMARRMARALKGDPAVFAQARALAHVLELPYTGPSLAGLGAGWAVAMQQLPIIGKAADCVVLFVPERRRIAHPFVVFSPVSAEECIERVCQQISDAKVAWVVHGTDAFKERVRAALLKDTETQGGVQ
jgi:hypothetical protein